MTIFIMLGILIFIGINLYNSDPQCIKFRGSIGLLLFCLGILGFIVNMFIWIPSSKDSEIRYNQLIQEKISIESMLETDRNIDKLLLTKSVIDYNNKIIEVKTNYKRFICRDYYNQDLDWHKLEIIEWR